MRPWPGREQRWLADRAVQRWSAEDQAGTSRLPSFLDDTEHLYDDSLRCQHFGKLFDEGHKQVL